MRRRTFAALALSFVAGLPSWADELGPRQLAQLIVRVLAYDRNLKKRSGDKVGVLVLYQDGNQVSESLSIDVSSALEDVANSSSVGGLPIRVHAIPYNGTGDLDAKLTSQHPSVVYLCSGLADALSGITAATRRRSVLTMTSVGAYVKSGAGIGLLSDEGRPAIVVNLPATRLEGADLDAALLRIANVIR